VLEIGALATKLINLKNEEITSQRGSHQQLHSQLYPAIQGPGGVIATKVTIGYDAPWRQVHALLITPRNRRQGSGMSRNHSCFSGSWRLYVEYELFAHIVDPLRRFYILTDLHAPSRSVQRVRVRSCPRTSGHSRRIPCSPPGRTGTQPRPAPEGAGSEYHEIAGTSGLELISDSWKRNPGICLRSWLRNMNGNAAEADLSGKICRKPALAKVSSRCTNALKDIGYKK